MRVAEKALSSLIAAFLVATVAHACNLIMAIRYARFYPLPGLIIPVSFVLVFGICLFPGAWRLWHHRWIEGSIVGAAGFGLAWVAFLLGTLIVGAAMGGAGFP